MRTTLLSCLLLVAPLALGLPGPAAASKAATKTEHAGAPASAAEARHEIAWAKDKPADTKVKDGIEGAAGATARCKDGSYSHAKQHGGACSRRGGVAEWLK